jgi:hypothetical protein
MGYNSLQNYYVSLFSLVQHHKYSVADVEDLIPFERDIFVEMLLQYLKEIEEQRKQNA